MPKRQIKSTCGNCRNNCTQVIIDEKRNAVFSDCWQYGDLTKQQQFIVENVTSLPKKGKRGEGKRHSFTYKYSLNGKIVCKTMFLNTLSISEKTVLTALQKRDENGIVGEDMRKGGNRKLSDEVKEEVKCHVRNFPTMEGHYVRERLTSNLNLQTMYNLYLQTNPRVQVSHSAYRDIFYHCFNLGFHKSKKDCCEICIEFENATAVQKQQLEEKYTHHQNNKAIA